ncbi:DUF3052 family protein [Flagellimonas allohymeniacidonis]|uniref:DUF3052 family protein n=1 Tax=Flagellimonas allohymeniacidonis TaxID=2517819 RepID=A0A4Q8QFE7_9FLAO|nr:DUF3052 family protein [Allomuricauda hymeniacidonis]TAI47263.1 DUF3052 family protein [Allomuricauda hymeniacidonis]
MSTSGYSGTPLAKKLGIKPEFIVQVFNAPKPYLSFFREFPDGVLLLDASDTAEVDLIHIFATTHAELTSAFAKAQPNLKKNGMLWVSWPKKTSKIPTEIDKFDVMKCGKEQGLVDTKVAAIDDQWSGHKFMYRVKDRK